MAEKRIWVRMSGYLVGDEKLINNLIAKHDGYDVDFDSYDIEGLSFVSDNEGYIPQDIVEEYEENNELYG